MGLAGKGRGRRSPIWIGRSLALLTALFVFVLGTGVASAKPAPRSFFGITPATPTHGDYGRVADLGAGSVRISINWRSVEPRLGDPFDWSQTDKYFRGATEAGLRPVPLIYGMPAELNVTVDPSHYEPPVHSIKQRVRWRSFAAAALERYGPGGMFWEENSELRSDLAPRDWIVWNEQNALHLWRPKPSVREYAKLLRATRTAFDRIDPAARLVVGGMYGYPGSDDAISARSFLRRLYRTDEARRLIDGVSVHPFARGFRQMKRQVRDARREMNGAGDRRAFLLVGELGWASGGSQDSPMIKTPRKQARLLRRSFNFLLAKRRPMRIKRVFWYTLRDYDSVACPFCSKTGLLRRNDSLKPAGRSYKRITGRYAR